MSIAELRAAIEAGIGSVEFEPPPTVAYCQAVYAAVRERVPEGTLVDVMHRYREVEVEVRRGVRRVSVPLPVV